MSINYDKGKNHGPSGQLARTYLNNWPNKATTFLLFLQQNLGNCRIRQVECEVCNFPKLSGYHRQLPNSGTYYFQQSTCTTLKHDLRAECLHYTRAGVFRKLIWTLRFSTLEHNVPYTCRMHFRYDRCRVSHRRNFASSFTIDFPLNFLFRP